MFGERSTPRSPLKYTVSNILEGNNPILNGYNPSLNLVYIKDETKHSIDNRANFENSVFICG